MSYVQKVLLPGERVVYETGLHWLVFGRAILGFILAVAIAIASAYSPTGVDTPLEFLALAVAAVGFVFLLAAALRRASTELAVTDQRVVYKQGFISRHLCGEV